VNGVAHVTFGIYGTHELEWKGIKHSWIGILPAASRALGPMRFTRLSDVNGVAHVTFGGG
jgi:hypothetical protein